MIGVRVPDLQRDHRTARTTCRVVRGGLDWGVVGMNAHRQQELLKECPKKVPGKALLISVPNPGKRSAGLANDRATGRWRADLPLHQLQNFRVTRQLASRPAEGNCSHGSQATQEVTKAVVAIRRFLASAYFRVIRIGSDHWNVKESSGHTASLKDLNRRSARGSV